MGVTDYGENYCHQQVYAKFAKAVGYEPGEVYGCS